MNRNAILAAAVATAVLAGGCLSPACLESQQSQLEAMVQYRGEMAAYHGKVQAHLTAEKRRELDAALAASLAQAADPDGRLALDAVIEKVRKRQDLEDEFRANLARLDGQFAARQTAFDRAIDLAGETLDVLESYGRLETLLRDLVGRETEVRAILGQYQSERSTDHAGSPDEPEAGGG